LAISDRKRNVWLREVETGKDLLTVPGFSAQGEPSVSALCFPHGTRVVIPWLGTNGERAARIFDWSERDANGPREVLRIAEGAFTEGFLPDGRLLLTISNRFGAYDCERQSFSPLPALGSPNVEVSSDGKLLAALDREQMCAVFLRPLDRPERSWLRSRTHGAATTAPGVFKFSPDNHWLFTGGRGGALYFWDTRTRELTWKIRVATPFNVAAFSPDGRWLAAVHDDGKVRLWTASTQAESPVFTNANLPCVLSPNGKYLAFMQWRLPPEATTAELDGFVVGEVATGKRVPVPSPGPDTLPVFVANDGATLAMMVHVTNGVFQLELCDVATQTRKPVRKFQVSHDTECQTAPVLFDAAGERVFTTNLAAVPVSGSLVNRPREVTNGPLWFWRATRDGRRLGFSDSRGALTVWDTASGSKLLDLPPALGLQTYWLFCEDGEQVCRSFQRGERWFVDSWRLSGARRAFEVQVPAPARDLAYSGDGHSLAVIYTPTEVLVLNADTGSQMLRIPGQFYGGDRLALSPDGKTIAVGGEYGRVELFQTATGRSLASLSLPEDWTHDSIYLGVKPSVARWPRLLAFSPDNETLMGVDWGGWVRVWRAPSFGKIEKGAGE
jgi:WD40 repeat protein